jgi:hypothetical protein
VHRGALAIVPLGTANLAARALGVPFRLDAALAAGFGGRDRRVDLEVADGMAFAGRSETNPNRSPDVEKICQGHASSTKVALAEGLWPRLQAKVRRDVASGNRLRVPAAWIGVRALRIGLSSRADMSQWAFGDTRIGAGSCRRDSTDVCL